MPGKNGDRIIPGDDFRGDHEKKEASAANRDPLAVILYPCAAFNETDRVAASFPVRGGTHEGAVGTKPGRGTGGG